MKPYSLLLISENNPNSPDNIHSSNQMITWGLWTELSKLPYVTMAYQKAYPDDDAEALRAKLAAQQVDFTLVHSYTPGPIFDEMPIVRSNTRREAGGYNE
jgi:hypothetical protein